MRRFVYYNAASVGLVINYIADDLVTFASWSIARRLSVSATKAIRVRRSSDNAEQDIGFVGDDLDTATLLSFTGAGSGYIAKVYDQSINLRDWTQSNLSLQPEIVASGVLKIAGTKPAFEHTGTRKIDLSISGISGLSIFGVSNLVTTSARTYLSEATNLDYFLLSQSGSASAKDSGVGTPTYYKDGSIVSPVHRGDVWNTYNGYHTLAALNVDLSNFTNFETERSGSGVGGWDFFQEMVWISLPVTDAIAIAINTNQKNYYGTP